MLIFYRSSSIQTICENYKKAARIHGYRNAKLLELRLTQIRAAACLADLQKLPQVHCHPLHGGRDKQWAVNLDNPQRLIFEPEMDDKVLLDEVKELTIVEITDYH